MRKIRIGLCGVVMGVSVGLSQPADVRFGRLTTADGLSHPTINAIYQDDYGFMWFGTSDGLNRFDGQKIIVFKNDPDDKETLVSNEIWSIQGDGSKIWIASSAGLNLFSYEDFSIHHIELGQKDVLTKITLRGDSIFCKGRLGDYAGLKRSNQLSQVRENLVLPEETRSRKTDSFTADGYTWIGSHNGLIRRNQATGLVERLEFQSYDPNSLSGNQIREVYKSREGVVWIGTWGAGLSFYDPQLHRFQHTAHKAYEPKSLNHDFVQCITRTRNKKLWVGTKEGLSILDPGRGEWRRFNIPSDDTSYLQTAYITGFMELEEKQELWIGTMTGIYVLNPDTEEVLKVYKDSTVGISNSRIASLLKDSDGAIWVGTWTNLLRYDPLSDNFVRVDHEFKSLASLDLIDLKDGRLLVGTYTHGVALVDKTGMWAEPIKAKHKGKPFSYSRVWTLHRSSNGRLWAGTFGQGLVELLPNQKGFNFKVLNENDGLGSNVVIAIEEDEQGNIWVAGNNGLSKLNCETGEFTNYDADYGLQGNHFNAASYKDPSGTLYFGGSFGLTWFEPANIQDNPYRPEVRLLGINLFNKAVKIGQDVLPKHISQMKGLTFNHDENSFSISFAGLCYSISSRTSYQYKLEGFEDYWHEVGVGQNQATYTNVPSGDYKFIVRAANHDGTWGEPTELAIHIKTPFWETWWFYTLLLVLSLLIIYMIYRVRIEQVRKVERLRTKIASDLHDEVGSLLTQISIQTDLMSQGVYEEQDKDDEIQKVAQTSRTAVKTMSDVVWSIDVRKEKMGDMIDRMKDYAMEMTSRTEIDVLFAVDGVKLEQSLSPEFRQNVYLLFKEALNNAVKHAQATRIDVSIGKHQDKFSLVIKDNGVGGSNGIGPKGQGLMNMEMRAKKLGGAVSIKKDDGYEIELLV